MSFFARVEAACANAVERAFAAAFPSPLEPVQIARKLVAAFEAGGKHERGGRRFVVRLSPADFAHLQTDRPYLERQWSAMLGRLAERSGLPQRPPEVRAEADAAIASGTILIAVEQLAEPARLALRVRKGIPPGTRIALDRPAVIGRDAECRLSLVDPRVSRRHLEIVPDGATLRFRDLHSSNGTSLNGRRADQGELALGDVVVVGDSELVVEAADG
ncbi:MAG: DUF3662 and FHA domain-containing protein [Candidatus Eremiobacteraeota bacterium]|nr:DUF3662 and FHA domain-containing protein [Candidatus Eremiobacteraeota bacterium]